MSFTIATWNVNSLRVRLPQVLTWLATVQPDVLALQETKVPNEDFPLAEINQAGYQVVFNGQKTYNGVAILTREKVQDVITDFAELDDHQRRVLGVTYQNIRILNLYVPNGESIVSEKYQYKLGWLNHLKIQLKHELSHHDKLIVLGDFNIAPHDQDVHDPKLWEGQVLFSAKEREALQEILNLGLQDCFRLQTQPEKSFSWWDYRLNAFKRNLGLRIDLILASPSLTMHCEHCYIDKDLRAAERPSDHAAVVAKFENV